MKRNYYKTGFGLAPAVEVRRAGRGPPPPRLLRQSAGGGVGRAGLHLGDGRQVLQGDGGGAVRGLPTGKRSRYACVTLVLHLRHTVKSSKEMEAGLLEVFRLMGGGRRAPLKCSRPSGKDACSPLRALQFPPTLRSRALQAGPWNLGAL
eukprot:7577497-Pyramimonas_sp.AAC.2